MPGFGYFPEATNQFSTNNEPRAPYPFVQRPPRSPTLRGYPPNSTYPPFGGIPAEYVAPAANPFALYSESQQMPSRTQPANARYSHQGLGPKKFPYYYSGSDEPLTGDDGPDKPRVEIISQGFIPSAEDVAIKSTPNEAVGSSAAASHASQEDSDSSTDSTVQANHSRTERNPTSNRARQGVKRRSSHQPRAFQSTEGADVGKSSLPAGAKRHELNKRGAEKPPTRQTRHTQLKEAKEKLASLQSKLAQAEAERKHDTAADLRYYAIPETEEKIRILE